MFTCDAEAIHQITSRREAFPKQTSNYKILSIFGRNMLAAEGAEWKMHRKGVSASFNERNAAHIFAESIQQTQGLISYWMGGGKQDDGKKRDGKDSGTILTLEHDTMTLALNIIAHVGFGLRLVWPGQALPANADTKIKKYGSHEPPKGHSMTFADSVATVLERVLLILLVPTRLLQILPFAATKAAYAARWNYEKYMHELLHDKKEAALSGEEEKPDSGMDIMGQLVRAKYSGKPAKGAVLPDDEQLTDQDIMGNAFIILLAGHETTANTLHFALVELATNPAAQRALQADVDRLMGRESDPRKWEYETHINALMASHVAACLNEVLRLTPSVADIPKEVSSGQEQSLVLEGRRHVLPKGMTIMVNTIATHRNPRYWPAAVAATANKEKRDGESEQQQDDDDDDLNTFLPERWYRASRTTTTGSSDQQSNANDEEDFGGFQGPDTSAQLYRPVRGSFIPFSDGARSCLGRRIAQVEMVAALAVLFQRYSVELAVDEWASDKEVEEMGTAARRDLYARARTRARETVRGATSLLTLKLHGDLRVPIRLVKRGEERFIGEWED